MVNIKTADLTSQGQKFIALLGIGVVLIILYFLLPPLVVIFANLWLLLGLAVPLIFLIYNYEIIWSVFKRLSWNMTKKIISTDKLWHMWQYYHYMVSKLDSLRSNIAEVGALEAETDRNVKTLIAQNNQLKREAVQHQERNSAAAIQKVIAGKVALTQKQIDSFLPKLEYIKAQKKALTELYDAWSADTELLKSTLEAKAQEYELMRKLNNANNSAMAFLQKDSPELREYNESLKQIEASVSEYTSNMENFQREVAPQLTRMAATASINESDGAALIEEYKKSRMKL